MTRLGVHCIDLMQFLVLSYIIINVFSFQWKRKRGKKDPPAVKVEGLGPFSPLQEDPSQNIRVTLFPWSLNESMM